MHMPASFPTLLIEKTTAGLRERERPHEGVLPKRSAQHQGRLKASARRRLQICGRPGVSPLSAWPLSTAMTCPNPRQRQTRCGAWSSPGPSPRHKSVAAHSDAVDGRPLAASPLQAAQGREVGVRAAMLVAPPEQVSHNRSLASSAIDGALPLEPIAATAPSWPLWSMRASLSQTAAEATKRTRSPIAPGSVRLPGGG